MAKTLIAAFGQYTEAEQVKQALLEQGIASGDIQLSASYNPDNLRSSNVDVGIDADESIGEKVRWFFRDIFPPHHSEEELLRYRDAIRQGSTIVTVMLADDGPVDAVEALLETHGALDIDQRQGNEVRPETASTEALTTGYPDATSVSTAVGEEDPTPAGRIAKEPARIPGVAENQKSSMARRNSAGRVRIITR